MHHGESRLWRRIAALRGCSIDQYAGNPASFPPTIGLIDDSDSPNASNFNACFGQGQSDRTMWLRQRLRGVRAQNWYGELAYATWLPAGTSWLTAAWDAANSGWLIVTNVSPNAGVYFTYGMDPAGLASDPTYTELGSILSLPAITNAAICADPNVQSQYWLASVRDDGTNNGTIVIYQKTPLGGWASNHTFVLSSLTTSRQKLNLLPFQSSIILGIGGDYAPGGSQILVWNGVSWTATGSLAISPACLEIGLCSNAANGGPNNLAIAFGRAAGSVNSTYWTTTNASTWTSRVFAFQTSTGTVTDIVWTVDLNGPCFLASHYDSSTQLTTFWRSSDGINWTPSGAPTTTIEVVSMAAIGEQIVGTLVDNGSGGIAGTVFSPDGGLTWYFGQATLTTTLANTDPKYMRARAFASPIGFLAMTALRTRWSHLQALPAVNL